MSNKPIKIPGPEHPIAVERNPSRVVVTLGGKVIADTFHALTLREAGYPPVHYIPRKDVDMAALTRSQHSTYCPYKGDASYYSIPAGGERSVNAIWTYENPYEAVAAIKEHVAFYPDRVDLIDERSRDTEQEAKNKAFVLEAFDTLFNRRDYAAAEMLWSPAYIQHSAHIQPGREGLFELVRNSPPTMRYENSAILAEGNLLMLHGRFSGIGTPAAWIVVDIVRLENGVLKEHWDVVQDEATRESSKSGLPMYGNDFPR